MPGIVASVSASGLLTKILPASAISEEMALPGTPDALLPEEAEHAAGFLPKRLAEYRATRHSARKALERLGVRNFPLLPGPDRAPIWPAHVAGSITHTGDQQAGWCGVAVAEKRNLRSLGIDAEDDTPLAREIWDDVLTLAERDALARLPEPERSVLAKVVFSAKEAVYKCQYPLSREFLEFHDLSVSLEPEHGTFVARFLRDVRAAFARGDTVQGRYVHTEGLVVTAVCVRAP